MEGCPDSPIFLPLKHRAAHNSLQATIVHKPVSLEIPVSSLPGSYSGKNTRMKTYMRTFEQHLQIRFLFFFCRWTSLAMWHCSRAVTVCLPQLKHCVARSRSCWCISVSNFVSVSPNWTSPSFGETNEKQPLCLASWKEDQTWMSICKV